VATKLSELLEAEGLIDEAAATLTELAADLAAADGRAIVADRVWLEVARLHARHEQWLELGAAAERLMEAGEIALRHEGAILAAEALQGAGEPREALQLLQRQEANFEDATRLEIKQAEILYALEENDEAARVLGDVLKDGDQSTLLAVAQFHLERSAPRDVVPVLETLLQGDSADDLDPTLRREVVLLLADSQLRVERPKAALAALDRNEEALRAAATELDRRRVALKRAEVLEALGRLSDADEILGLLADQNDRQSALLLVQYYQRETRYEEMIPVLNRALEAADAGGGSVEDIDLYFSRGMANERLGRFSDAEAAFRRVLDLDPDDGRTLNYLGYMWAEQGRRLDEALDLIRRAVALEPDNGAYLDSLGWAFYQLERYEEARTHLETAARLQPEDATILEHLGDLYVALEIPDKARELYRRALAKEDENVEGVRRKLAQLGTGDA
jgi:tetratricopeptide (TPR) repeat protein